MTEKKLAFKRAPKVYGSKNPYYTKRINIDVTPEMHRRVKMGCAARGVGIMELVRGFLDREFPKE